MSTPHPSIAGVTVEEYTNGHDNLCRALTTVFPPESRYDAATELVVVADSGAASGPIGVMCSFDTQDGLWFEPDEAETVIAMIRDQAAWLDAQGATT